MTIFIFALHGIATGGPEATHQLSDALLEHGFDAKLIYFRWDDLKAGPLAEMPAYEPFAPEYARYKTSLARQAIDDEGHVIVLPETLAHAAPFFQRAKVLVWWLSVDNAVSSFAQCQREAFAAPNVCHAAQSQYARAFIDDMGWRFSGMLSDYTPSLDVYAVPMAWSQRPPLVAFNMRPDKVLANQLDGIVSAIHHTAPEAKFVAIAGMKRAEVAAVLAAARVCVDVGTFPGKDRLPREAASMGCHPLVGSRGAGAWDFPGWTLSDWPPCWPAEIITAMNSPMAPRYNLLAEQHTFNTEVRNVFAQLV